MKRNMTENPLTNNPWTGSEVNSWSLNGEQINFGVNNQKRQGSEIRVTEIWLEVNVKDEKPIITQMPTDKIVEAESRDGAFVDFIDEIEVWDDLDPAPEISCTPSSGSEFPISNLITETTTVECIAIDFSNQESDPKYFDITVQDTTPPEFDSTPITPVDGGFTIGIHTPVDIDLGPVNATDLVSDFSLGEITIEDNRNSTGSALSDSPLCNKAPLTDPEFTCFNAGSTTVTYNATDVAGNSVLFSQNVNVTPTDLAMEWEEEGGLETIGSEVYFAIDDYRANRNNSITDEVLTTDTEITVKITSSSDQNGILVKLNENNFQSHVFDGTFKLHASISDENPLVGPPLLEASHNDEILITYSTIDAPNGYGVLSSATINSTARDRLSLEPLSGAVPSPEEPITFDVGDALELGSGSLIQILDPELNTDATRERYPDTGNGNPSVLTVKNDLTGDNFQSANILIREKGTDVDFFRSVPSIIATDDINDSAPDNGIFFAPVGSMLIAEYDGNTSIVEIINPPEIGELVTFDVDYIKVEDCEDGDSDQDGICDSWENPVLNGLTIPLTNADGVQIGEYFLPCKEIDGVPPVDTSCPSPERKDLYLEIDYMSGHEPDPLAIAAVVQMFDNAPVDSTSDNPGIELHAIVDEDIHLHRNIIPLSNNDPLNPGFKELKKAWFGSALERGCTVEEDPSGIEVILCRELEENEKTAVENALTAKRQVFHYVLFAHSLEGQVTSSGWAELPGNDIIITLGSYAGNNPDDNNGVGSVDQQAATLAHEVGHNLGLSHNGKIDRPDSRNCAPNYLSIMSYSFQFADLVSDRPLDYSRERLPALVKSQLNELTPIKEYKWPDANGRILDTIFGFFDSNSNQQAAAKVSTGGASIDWNQDGVIDSTGTLYSEQISNIGIPGCDVDQGGTKTLGWNDWANIIFDFRLEGTFASGAYTSVDALDEPDKEFFTFAQASLLDVLSAAIIDSDLPLTLLDDVESIDALISTDPDNPDYLGAIAILENMDTSDDIETDNIRKSILETFRGNIEVADTDHSVAEIPIADAGGTGGGDTFTDFYRADEGSLLILNGSQSTDPDRCSPLELCLSLTNYHWLNDETLPVYSASWGQTSQNNGENSTTYIIGLQVTDDGLDESGEEYADKLKRTSTVDNAAVVIDNVPPTIGDVVNATINEGQLFNITVAFTDPGFLDTHTATIDWGDDVTESGNIVEADGDGTITASHLYSSGNWTGTITVDDGDGGTDSDKFTVEVLNIPPEIIIETPPPETIIFGQNVTISGTINDSGETFEIGIGWNGELEPDLEPIGSDFEVSHTYDQSSDGTFTLTIKVCDVGIPKQCTTISYIVSVKYIFGGFESPLAGAQYEKGRTLPVKVGVLNFENQPVETAEVRVFWTDKPAVGANSSEPGPICPLEYFLNDSTFEFNCVDANPTAAETKKASAENISTFKQGVYQYQMMTESIPLGEIRIIVLLDDGTLHSSPPITVK
jgi:hypothetical protein